MKNKNETELGGKKSVLDNMPGVQPVDPKKLEKLDKGMKKLYEGWREKEVKRQQANAIARNWLAK